MRPIIYPYKMGSKSARTLADALEGSRRVYPDRRYRYYRNHKIINWGSTTIPNWFQGSQRWLNHPSQVKLASNKVLSFQRLQDMKVPIPSFSRHAESAYEWNCDVMVRQTLTGHSGQGCVHVDREDRELLTGSLAGAPLYTEYIKKSKEVRVHLCRQADGRGGTWVQPIDYQEKKVREGSEGNDFQIRSHENGWIFARTGVEIVPIAQVIARDAVNALGLDFGAVDMIYNSHRNQWFVLEVNTAPGLEGETVNSYAKALRTLL